MSRVLVPKQTWTTAAAATFVLKSPKKAAQSSEFGEILGGEACRTAEIQSTTVGHCYWC